MIGQNGVGVLMGHNGVQDKTTLNPANETVAKGIYDATTLSAVDADLAVSNIKSGITMFGFAGVATVQDIADADAVLADVKNGKTFYSVTGGRKTGNLATVSLSAAANSYPAGYHAGDTSLTAVDADLATANIKSGVTIFGVTGSTDVRDSTDADAAVGNVLSPKTFYAGGGARKTGTMATRTLSAANETVTAGYYAATTLSAVDGDLAVGNIKSGVTIFGFAGTYTGGALAEDIVGSADLGVVATTGPQLSKYNYRLLDATSEEDIIEKTQTYDADSLAIAFSFCHSTIQWVNEMKLRLWMDGVQMAESGWIPSSATGGLPIVLTGTRALSGSTICKLSVINNRSGTNFLQIPGMADVNQTPAVVIAIGSIKS